MIPYNKLNLMNILYHNLKNMNWIKKYRKGGLSKSLTS